MTLGLLLTHKNFLTNISIYVPAVTSADEDKASFYKSA